MGEANVSVNTAGVAAPSSGEKTNTTGSIIPGDDYASGGPKQDESEGVDLSDFFESEDDAGTESGPGLGSDGQAVDENPVKEPVEEIDEGTDKDSGVPGPVKTQSPEANAAFAEMRRQVEQAQKELQNRDNWVKETFGATHGITTWQQYQAAIENTHRNEQLAKQNELQQRPQQVFNEAYQKLTDDGYDETMAKMIANAQATVTAQGLQTQALQNEIAQIKRQEQERQRLAEQAQQQAMQQQIAQGITIDHEKLRKEYGDLVPKALGEIDSETVDRVKRGYSLYDAWFITNKTKVLEKAQKAEAQKTLNKINSKSHLKTEGDGAGDSNASATPLPADTLQMYKDSGMTERQARAFHKKLYG